MPDQEATQTGDATSLLSVSRLRTATQGTKKPRDSGASGADDGNRTRVISLED